VRPSIPKLEFSEMPHLQWLTSALRIEFGHPSA
jgi:hypothetical protein